MNLLKTIKMNLVNKLQNQNYRHEFFKGRSQDEIAAAIRDLREKRELTQVRLAELCEMKQSAISRIEKPSYARWNFKTLWRIAEVLDGRWRLVLEPMEDVLREYEWREKQLNAQQAPKPIVITQDQPAIPIYNPLAPIPQEGILGEMKAGEKTRQQVALGVSTL